MFVAAAVTMVVAIPAQRRSFSTFDFTTTAGSPADLREAFADCKAPGDGRVYAVGSIELLEVPASPTFSNAAVLVAPSMGLFTTAMRRQVGIVQRSASQDGSIERQAYYYGFTPPLGGEEVEGLHTNVRAVSVFAAESPEDARVAICGESSDLELPLSGGIANQNSGTSYASPVYMGFIAVFDGNLNLLWDYPLLGRDEFGHAAVTDLAIRRDSETGADIVTYCGISSHGVGSSGNRSLQPVRPFLLGVPGVADGDSDNGSQNWDGFVGRITNLGSTPGNAVVNFHSVVGGVDQDGLFGLAEISEDRFVVVGSTSAVQPGAGLQFPFTVPIQPTNNGYCMGTVLVFDANPSGSNLILEASNSVGTGASDGVGPNTVARDVFVHFDAVPGDPATTPPGQPSHAIHVVGSTDDPDLFTSPVVKPFIGPQLALAGGTDGFLISARDVPAVPVIFFQQGTFHGGAGDDMLTGVAGWNEHKDHLTVFGCTQGMTGSPGVDNFEVCTYFFDTPTLVTADTLSDPIRLLRTSLVATLDQVPTAMGAFEVTSSVAPAWNSHGLGSPAGGGVTVEQRGRISLVGMSPASSTYPVDGPSARTGRGGNDAVRTDIDMLPADPAVFLGRTDLTGDLLPVPGTANGGTTPVLPLSQFGVRVGDPTPPALLRMHLDWDGPLPNSGQTVNTAVVLDRPEFASNLGSLFVAIGIPSNPMTVFSSPFTPQVEWWLDPTSMFTTSFAQGSTPGFDRSLRFPLSFPPSGTGSLTFTLQAITMISVPNLPFAGSAGMVVQY